MTELTKETAKALLTWYSLAAVNHKVNCPCGKTAQGAAQTHFGKTEEEFLAIYELANS